MSGPGENAVLKIIRLVEGLETTVKAQNELLLDLVNMVNEAGGVFQSHDKPFAGVLLQVDEFKLAIAYVEACKLLGKEPRINKR